MRLNDATRRYFEDPPCVGELAGPGVCRGAAGSREAGTWVQFDLRLVPGSTDRIECARFLAYGCPHTIAAAAWVAQQAPGRLLRQGFPEDVHRLRERFEAPIEKLGRLLTVEDAWLAAAAAVPA